MILSDLAVKRPVLATVVSLLLIAFGIVSFSKLPLREFPDIDPPIVSIDTRYVGASASVVETKITQMIEDRVAGIEGIKFISSSSSDGRSRINIEFEISRDIDAAANDVRDRVSGVIDNLPDGSEPPDVQKADSSDDVIMWLNLTSKNMNTLELTNYAKRYLEDRFSVLPGVARVRIGGGESYSMRVWLDRKKMAARNITVEDITNALRQENVELPAGSIESQQTVFTARVARSYESEEDFRKLVISQNNGYLVRLGDVASVAKEAAESRILFRGNGVPMVGIGIIKQSKANTIGVANAAATLAKDLQDRLPEGMEIINSYDTSVFIKQAIIEVYKTLFFASMMVTLVIYMFLGSFRAMLIPAVTVPVSLCASCIILFALGYSINMLTLLALVLAIGLVVDDAIVVIENIYRRIELGETPLVAAFYGTRQVGFAVVATTLVTIAVFVPITYLDGDLGRLFTEFAVTIIAAVSFSTFVALTLCAMLASKLLRKPERKGLSYKIDHWFAAMAGMYTTLLQKMLRAHRVVLVIFVLLLGVAYALFKIIPAEYIPSEDRGAFFIVVNGPEGASYTFTKTYMEEIERRLMPYTESGEFSRLLVRAPRQFGRATSFNSGLVIVVLDDWSKRRPAKVIIDEINQKLRDLPGVRVSAVMRQGLRRSISKPVQFVIGGGTYQELATWRDIMLEEIAKNNPGITDIDTDYKETQPQLRINVDQERAADLAISSRTIGETLEVMLGSKNVTTFVDDGEEYDVIVEGVRDKMRTPINIENIYLRSGNNEQLIPLANIIDIQETSGSASLERYNKVRAITIEAGLENKLTLGAAITYLNQLARDKLPKNATIDYKGQSLDYQNSRDSIWFVFALGLFVVFMVLAAQFESFVHPFVIITTVPLAIIGALFGIYLSGNTLNIYTQIGLIMLIGLAAKNGILIVEFINQLRDQGVEFRDAILQSARIRFRPIVMTGITTVAGSVPLVLAHGAGAETRMAVGIVILCGVLVATIMTLFVVPIAYEIFARNTGSPLATTKRLEDEAASRSSNNEHI